MNEHRDEFSLMLMCRVAKVARAGFYQRLHQPVSERAKEDARLVEAIRYSYSASGGVYGANFVFGDLREAGETCGRDRVARLMQVNKSKAVRGYKAPIRIAGRPSIIAPNRLHREFTVDAPDHAWVTVSPIFERGRAGFTWPS
jgi:putative transposase